MKNFKLALILSLISSISYADVNISGYVLGTLNETTGYGNYGDGQNYNTSGQNGRETYTEYELVASLTKTTRGGLTFGSEFIVSDDQNSSDTAASNATAKANAFISNAFGMAKIGNGNLYSAIRTKAVVYVRNSFDAGQLDHKNRIYSLGTSSLSDGYLIRTVRPTTLTVNDNPRSVRANHTRGGFYLETPNIYGFSAAYSGNNTTKNNLKEETSFGVNVSQVLWGISIDGGYGEIKNLGGDQNETSQIGSTVDKLWAAKLGYGGLSVSYSENVSKYFVSGDGRSIYDLKTRDNRIGVGLDVRGISLSYVNIKEDNIYDKTQSDRHSDSYSGSYLVADGFTLGATYTSDGFTGGKTTYFGTEVTF